MMTNDGSSPYTEQFITVQTIYHDLINNFLFYLHISHSIHHCKIITSENRFFFADNFAELMFLTLRST